MAQLRRWHIYPTADELERHAAQAIARAADQAIGRTGRFTIVLAGGATPRRVYARLSAMPAQWPRWHVYFGDERCRPVGDSERNDGMAHEVWLDRVEIPRTQMHAIPAELGPAQAARRYAEVVATVDDFDLVLLGLGEDGHTASLFPGEPATSGEATVAVYNASKSPPERVSLSAARLARAHQVVFLVSGPGKRQAIDRWRRGDSIPAARVAPAAGVDILLDVAAWPEQCA